mmetsp:Transcript_4697/g.6908  ORF Transcript_4697/g.6908 Transcript_4697/m.6908 type:complete len:206 (-) Transcript_4697:144-761(-)|eukprot:CAMPEP_0194301508 /NCGR_PEP_ID=MMETSP0169-20130528/61832_1 /TAXON_ID=218684 /ORGANISM="Corethron pennatum, Strain L29A3" /LENGTH=205 /DNA_ID=CAMNT_0039051759 /DNA_START=114 /DNA_END=731 /DNA_ORIENTATION=+
MMNGCTTTSNNHIRQDESNDHSDEAVIIRTYKATDLSQVRNLFVDGMKHNTSPDSYVRHSLSSDLSSMEETYFTAGRGRGTFFVMEEKRQSTCDDDGSECHDGHGRIVGIVGLQDLNETCNTCELRRMSVHSSLRRQGRGRQLVQTCIAHARKKGFAGIVLSTGAWMKAAISFYVSMGFEDRGRTEHVLPDGNVAIIAKLELLFV